MANYIYVGRIVGTHGLKGELKIISDEVFLDKIFKPNNNLYIGDEYQKEQIATYRIHKNYNLVSLTNHQDINRINDFLNKDVYINKEEIDVEYLLSDLIDCDIIDDQKYGKVIDIETVAQNAYGWWFGDDSGWYAKSCTIRIDDVMYTFNAKGYLVP